SEVQRLTWAQVDFQAGVVRLELRSTKNDEGRTFPFDALPALQRLLKRQRARTTALERTTGRIIPHVFHRDGQPVRYFRRAWRSALDRAAHATRSSVRAVIPARAPRAHPTRPPPHRRPQLGARRRARARGDATYRPQD